jgi:hypothetical protein
MRATVLVAGARTRDDAAAWLAARAGLRTAVFVEGLLHDPGLSEDVAVTRLPAGCVCCLGQVPFRVNLTQALRAVRPDEILLILQDGGHRERVHALLAGGSLGVRFEVE